MSTKQTGKFQPRRQIAEIRDYIIVKSGTNHQLSPLMFTDAKKEPRQADKSNGYEAACKLAGKLGGVVTSLAYIEKKYGNVVLSK